MEANDKKPAPKKRKSKYEKKLAVNVDFEQLLQITLQGKQPASKKAS